MHNPPSLLPSPVLDKVLNTLPTWIYGLEGSWNQARLIDNGFGLAQSDPDLIPFAAGLLYWSWQQRPLDKSLLELLLHADAQLPQLRLLDRDSRAFLLPLRRLLALADAGEFEDWNTLASRGQDSRDKALGYILDRISDPRLGLQWLGHGFEIFLNNGWFAEVRTLLDRVAVNQALAPLVRRLEAEWAFHALDRETAAKHLDALDPGLFGWWRDVFRGALAAQAGDTDQAATHLTAVVRRFPWHVNLLLKLHDLLAPRPAPVLPDATRSVCALLYSWNKAADLAATLETLQHSRLGGCRVLALDNGSTDATGAVIEKFCSAWPHAGGFEAVRLPVNIGAPAARNWLLNLPQAASCDYVAFLDDDIILPADWLEQLLGQAVANPEAGAVGCNIVGHLPPYAVQAADFHLLHPDTAVGGFTDYAEHVFVANNCIGLRDAGFFDYARPCVSVTGCCHLLSRQSLDAAGHFDICFAPSQFDDLDRDLRAAAKGFPSFYNGRLQIRHVQHSSLVQAATRSKQAQIHGNKLKLEHLHSVEELRQTVASDQNALQQDLKKKLKFLDERLATLPE